MKMPAITAFEGPVLAIFNFTSLVMSL